MWSPTHVQVTVQKARGLIPKGRNGTNNAFVTIALGKDKFQTSVKEKATDTIEWHERCELVIPKHGNRAEIVLTALHHNFLGADEFLGCVRLPLAEMDVYERPKNRWFKLKSKAGKEKNSSKDRGEMEVKIAFTVKSGSLSDLSQKSKHKSSLGQLSQAAQSFGGSLISITSLGKDKGLKVLAGKIGGKIAKPFHRKDGKSGNNQLYTPEPSRQVVGDADPGVISDDDFTLDELSHEGSGCSLDVSSTVQEHNRPTASVDSVSNSHSEVSSPPTTPRSVKLDKLDWKSESDLKKPVKMMKDSGVVDTMKRRLSVLSSTSLSSTKEVSEDDEIKDMKKPDHHTDQDKSSGFKGSLERIIIGKEITRTSSPVSGLHQEVIKQYEGKSREDLIEIIINLQSKLTVQQRRQRDLEDYLDNLLLRVMETSPRLLQNPYVSYKSHV